MKTVYEAASDYALSREDNDYTIETEMAFIAGAEFAQRWISIEEELPPQNIPIIAKYICNEEECYWTGKLLMPTEKMKYFIDTHFKFTQWRLI